MGRFGRVKTVRDILFGHALVRAIAIGLFSILASVLSGSYIFEITKVDTVRVQFLDWSDSFHSVSFWALGGILLLMGLYGWRVARFEALVQKELALTQPAARAVSELLVPMIEKAKQDIKDDKLKTMEEVRKMFTIEEGRLR